MTSALTADARSAVAALPRARMSAATIGHLVTLAVAPLVLVSQYAGQWFYWDEFEYLGSSRDQFSLVENLLQPHNEHWSALTAIAYGVLDGPVGLRAYWPYLLPVLMFHLLTVHLLWRLMIRLGANGWIATAVAAVFGVAGAGYENLVWAFQLGFVASTACGLAAVLMVVGAGPWPSRRRVAFIVLVTVNLAISGLALIWLVVCALLLLGRVGVRAAAAAIALPVVVYAVWYLSFGVQPATKEVAGWALVASVSEFALVGLASMGLRLMGLEPQSSMWSVVLAISVVSFLAVVSWLRARSGDALARQAATIALFAPLFFIVAGTARVRVADGVATAGASRYYYVVLAAVIPVVAVLLTWLVERHSRLVTLVAVGLAVNLALAVGAYVKGANEWRREWAPFHQTVAAEMELLRRGARVYPENRPESWLSPGYLSQDDLRRWMATDAFESVPLDDVDRATAALLLQVAIHPQSDAVTCPPPAPGAGRVLVVPKAGTVGVVLTTEDGVTSRVRKQDLGPGSYSVRLLTEGSLRVDPEEALASLCAP